MSIPTEHPYPFDPTHGFGLDELRAMAPPEAPPGFDEFWQARHARALAVAPQPKLSPSEFSHPDWDVLDLTYTSTGEFQVGGWLSLPRGGVIRRGLVVGHGYGGRDQPDADIPVGDTALLFPCFRGLSRSRHPHVASDPAAHVLHGIGDPARYILGGCVDDVWLAVSVLTQLYPAIDGRIGYSGTSFGGGIGALAIAFDKRIRRGHLALPTFGNMPVWLALPSVGSAQAVQAYRDTHQGDVLDTLRLFDAATTASRIAVPMLVAVARFDPAVAPPCQFSIANALPTSISREVVVLAAGHFDYPEAAQQHTALQAKVGRFFATS